MGANGRLLLVEMVLPEGDPPHPGKLLDMLMLSVPGGEERTPSQDSALLDKAGFRMTQVVPTQSLVGIVEAVPKRPSRSRRPSGLLPGLVRPQASGLRPQGWARLKAMGRRPQVPPAEFSRRRRGFGEAD